jgi:hypothetical protein
MLHAVQQSVADPWRIASCIRPTHLRERRLRIWSRTFAVVPAELLLRRAALQKSAMVFLAAQTKFLVEAAPAP